MKRNGHRLVGLSDMLLCERAKVYRDCFGAFEKLRVVSVGNSYGQSEAVFSPGANRRCHIEDPLRS